MSPSVRSLCETIPTSRAAGLVSPSVRSLCETIPTSRAAGRREIDANGYDSVQVENVTQPFNSSTIHMT